MTAAFAVFLSAALWQLPDVYMDSASVCIECHVLEGPGAVGVRTSHPAALGSPDDAHAEVECTECHLNVRGVSRQGQMVSAKTETLTDVLDIAVDAGRGRTAVITLRSCRECHEQQFLDWSSSTHGAAAREYAGIPRDGREPPLCTDCHGAHGMRWRGDPLNPVDARNVPDTCARCHNDERVMPTYSASVHGQKRSLEGRSRAVCVAVCSSCHGHHDILSATDPASRLYKPRRAEVCAECHPGAHDRFAESFSHRDPTANPIVNGVNIAHMVLTGLVAGCMLLFMGSEAFRVLKCLVLGRPLMQAKPSPRPRTIRRWSLCVRMQHWVLVASFTVLAVTGIPLMYPNAIASRFIIDILGGTKSAGLIHRGGAVALMGLAVWHMAWVVSCFLRGARWSPMLPSLADVRAATGLVLYAWGLSRNRPKMARYAPPEKFEYFAAFCGTIVMTATGLLLWFPVQGAHLVGGLGIELAQIMHGHEGILAVLVILIIHICWVHFMPGFWPMSSVWLTGNISREAMEEYHAAELAEMDASGEEGALEP